MLTYLRVRGLALLEDVTLELPSGMSVLTGETGAGKSIIVDALSLLRGARARGEVIRAGSDAAVVDAQFELGPRVADSVASALVAHGLPHDEPGALVLQRSVARAGRGRCFVQGELTTQAVLGDVGAELVDICSQHEHHSLTHVAEHVTLLDGFAQHAEAVRAYGAVYRALVEVRAERVALTARAEAALARADYLRYQLEEIARVAPSAGERAELTARARLLRDARTWAELAQGAYDELYESEPSIAGRLAALAERARRGADHSPRLAAMAEQLDLARIGCEEAAHAARGLSDDLDFEPGELLRVEERLAELDGLARKHGDLDRLLDRQSAMSAELGELETADERLAALTAREAALAAECLALARALSDARRSAARRLGRELESELAALHMPRARLEPRVDSLAAEALGPNGLDRVEFLFSANAGEPLAPLTRVASGGELSRVLLALKGVLRAGDRVATYVFDEVDAGVGGAVAEAIGRRLRGAAESHQVLCITHLPQIAAFADAHYRVTKVSRGERTVTRVERLDDEARVDELARMLGGARITDTAREHARQLLTEARGRPAPAARRAARAARKRGAS